MELYSSPSCYCHCVRIVLAEKDIGVTIHNVDTDNLPEDLLDLNPYQSLPTLVDRDLVLYDYRVIMEYLDERFPHPPLLPPDPIYRARARLTLNRIDQDWYGLLALLDGASSEERKQASKLLREGLAASAVLFKTKPFFLNEEFSLLDCSLAPLLWRLPYFGIRLPAPAKAIQGYAERIFARPAFQQSLNATEREMRSPKPVL